MVTAQELKTASKYQSIFTFLLYFLDDKIR